MTVTKRFLLVLVLSFAAFVVMACSAGDAGPAGVQGPQGSTGTTGPQGAQGQEGLAGQDGQDGTDGQDGSDSLSVYEQYVIFNPGYQGSELKWYTELREGTLDLFSNVTLNGGSMPEDFSFMKGMPLASIPEPTREGAEFLGWFLDQDFTTAFDEEEYLLDDVQLFAKWDIDYVPEPDPDDDDEEEVPGEVITITESFEGIVDAAYSAAGTFEGDSGIVWTFVDASKGTEETSEEAWSGLAFIQLRATVPSRLEASFTGGLDSLTIMTRAFAAGRSFDIIINEGEVDELIINVIDIDAAQIKTVTFENLGIEGDFTLVITNFSNPIKIYGLELIQE